METMSALGHKRTVATPTGMSALPPKAETCSALVHVCFCPKSGHERHLLSPSRRHVAKDILAIADEDDAVSGRIATIPFDLGIGNCKTPSVLDVKATKWYVLACV